MNYLNRFSPHLAELSEPLREVCRQDTEFQLTKSVCAAFSKTKEEISKNVTLPYFNPSDTTLQTDLGVTLQTIQGLDALQTLMQ